MVFVININNESSGWKNSKDYSALKLILNMRKKSKASIKPVNFISGAVITFTSGIRL